jgi:hypothetical protein
LPHYNKNVIPFRPSEWTFLDYVEDGQDVIEEWYESQSLETQLAFDKLLKQNVKIKNHLEWIGRRHKMRGKGKTKIFELEFAAEDRANRILCVFDGVMRTVMLCGCYHKNKIWYPAGALEKAERRARTVADGTAKLKVKKIRTDR